MFGKNPRLNPLAPWNNEREVRNRRGTRYSTGLAARKQLLIVESELNRHQLVQDWQTMADEGHALANRARNITFLASAAASVMAVLSSLRRKKSAPAAEKPSRWQSILKVAGVVTTLWPAFRRRPKG